MPSIGNAIYWHTGSMYMVVSCTFLWTLGLLLRCSMQQSRQRAIWRGALLVLCGFVMGGSFYGPMLGAFVAVLLLALQGVIRRSPMRIYSLMALAAFVASLIISLLSPGNQLRQERFGTPMGIGPALITSILDACDLIGAWLSPQLLAMLLLILPVLRHPLRESKPAFRHPIYFLVLFFGVFAATLTPGIYTGASYGMDRYMNVVYVHFLLMALGSAVYALWWFIRWLEKRTKSINAQKILALSVGLGQRFTAPYIAIVLALLVLGSFAFTIMNTSSVSEVRSLVSGEAARFQQDMKARKEYIRVTDSDEVDVRALGSQPLYSRKMCFSSKVFMGVSDI